ncbi:hypothetical protein BDN71DRAFT_1455486 [Pleurotus eryngii]|uniref:Integral membrane bound transporter domain-containing protein n=1 Tax=Pleurotus eryngii TaxID=5323 RepID=A0A9P5ZLQ7_PLEER|nr:hypothetical protein BDN71DRAFT_1455486 [Pleurotus eryngii]
MSFLQFCSPWISRRFVARLLSTVICAILIVVRPFSRYGVPYAFLALSLKELIFSVHETIAQQLESTILGLLGGLLGIGLSSLGTFIASLPTVDSVTARAIRAIFLAFTCFGGGWAKSRLPRLTHAARICCFIAIWLLTADVTLEETIRDYAVSFLWVLLVAAFAPLISSLMILRWSSAQFATDIATAFAISHDCLSHSLEAAFSCSHTPIAAQNQLLKMSVALNQRYSEASFELRVGRVGVKSIKPLIGTIEHLRRELSWGMVHSRTQPAPLHVHSTSPDEKEKDANAFRVPAYELGHAVLTSMRVVERTVLTCYELNIMPRQRDEAKGNLDEALNSLYKAAVVARDVLKSFTDGLDMQQRAEDGAIGFPQKSFDLCLFMISLLQMAHEMKHALYLCKKLTTLHEVSSPRLWHPHFSWAWLGAAPSTFIMEERGAILDEDSPDPQAETALSLTETLQGISENQYPSDQPDDNDPDGYPNNDPDDTPEVLRRRRIHGRVMSMRWMASVIHHVWNYAAVLRTRLKVSRTLRAVQHSSHLRHAIKNSGGIVLLSLPAFLPTDSSGYSWFYWARGQWMVISYLWVLETNTGATWRVGYLRISGTILGCVYGYITYVICQSNPYALVLMLTLSELPISWIITNTTFPSLGVVAAVTLPPLTFVKFFSPKSEPSQIMLVVLRGLMIAAGIIAALFVNSLFFPRHCRVMFLNNISRTIGIVSQLYLSLSRDLFCNSLTSSVLEKQKILKLEVRIRNALHRMNLLLITMNDELSLVPKPMKRYRQIVINLQKLLDLLTGIRKIREKIPRKETVTAVVTQRREFVSCVCVCLFAVEQVFRARQPLPQFLPSARLALMTLEMHVEERIRQSREEHLGGLGLPIVYAFAEADVLRELVDTLEDLLELSRQLFGTSSWYSYGPLDMSVMTSIHEEVGEPSRSR